MFCPNCGKQNSEETKFCTNCGYRLNVLTPESINSNKPYVEPNASYNTPVNPKQDKIENKNIVNKSTGKPVNSALVNNLSNVRYADISKISANKNNKSSDSKKPKKIALGIGIPVIFVIIVCVLIAILFPKIKMALMGESTYYFYNEAQNISSILSADELSDLRHPNSYSARSVVEADCTDFEELSDILNSMKVTASVDYDKSTATVVSSASLKDSNNTILTLNGNYLNSKFIVGSNVVDSQLFFDNPFLMNMSEKTVGNDVTDSIENFGYELSDEEVKTIQYLLEADREEFVKVVRKVLCDYVDEKAVTTKGKIDGKNVNVVTFTFEGKDIDFILTQFLKEIINNDKLSPTLEKIIKLYASYEDEDISLRSDSDISEFVDDYFGFSYFIDTLTFTYSYDFSGNILNRGYVLDFGDYTSKGDINTTFNNSDVATLEAEFMPDSDFQDEVINVYFSKEVKNNSLSIKLDYSDYYSNFYLTVDNMRSEKCGGVPVLLGDMNVVLSKYGEQVFEFDAKTQTAGSQYDILMNLDIEYSGSYNGSISTSLSTDSNVSGADIPTKYETDIPTYFEDLFSEISVTVSEYIEENYLDY